MPSANTIKSILEKLNQTYPDATYELHWETPLQLLVATILAAQCTDERVNQVTPELFAKYGDAEAFADADVSELALDIRTISFNRKKAKRIQEVCQMLEEKFHGQVPDHMDDMLILPGVARKTANVVLNIAYRIPSGIIVDSHVARVSKRLGLSDKKQTEKMEKELMELIPEDQWVTFGPALVLHGRYVCTAKAPKCSECILEEMCPKNGLDNEEEEE